MRRYNYFDDDPPEKEKSEFKSQFKIDIKSINLKKLDIKKFDAKTDIKKLAHIVKEKTDTIVHNEALQKKFSNAKTVSVSSDRKTVLLKLSAFVFFILAIIIFILIFNHSINLQNKKNHQYYADAGKVCTDCIIDHGISKFENLKSDEYGKDMARLTGLCYARQMDFDSDGNDELMLCYSDKNVYTLEIWSYVDKEFTKIYSDEANKTNDVKDGSWIAFYYHNNKYYICKSQPDTPEKVSFLALKGDKFKEGDSCDYDYKNNIYSIDGEINANDFETIKLSVISASKAERIVDTVLDNISQFNTISVSTLNRQKTEAQLKAAAYSEIIQNRIDRYGEAKVESDGSASYIDGLALVKLIDFNADGNEELLLVYRKMVKQRLENAYNGEYIVTEEPTYCIEVYSWNGSVTKKIFNRTSISNYMLDNDTNYILLKNNEKSVDICSNSYSYTNENNYTAASRIFTYGNDDFECTFSARQENSYGYKSYYLDGEYAYRSSFEDKAYQVPKFLNDSADFDKEKYTFIYFSGKNSSEFQSTVNETNKVITELENS